MRRRAFGRFGLNDQMAAAFFGMSKDHLPKELFISYDSVNGLKCGYSKKEVMEYRENATIVGRYKLTSVEEVKKELVSKKIA